MAGAIAFEVPWLLLPGLPPGIAFLVLLVFFRAPERRPGRGIVSPADGRVLEADEAGRLVVFMGLSNVHGNRAPLDGRIAAMMHTRGGHAPAYRPEARQNERGETVVGTAIGPVKLLQGAGAIARRLGAYPAEGHRG